jgi:hypothetical protein
MPITILMMLTVYGCGFNEEFLSIVAQKAGFFYLSSYLAIGVYCGYEFLYT